MKDIIDKVKHMLKKTATNGATEEEAQSSLLMAQKMMAKYGLSLSDVQDVAEKKEVVVGGTAENSKVERYVWWKGRLASILADNFRCYSYFTSYGNGKMEVQFLGMKNDVELTVELYKYATKAVEHLAKSYVEKRKKEAEEAMGINFKEMTGDELEELALANDIHLASLRYKYGHDEKIYKMRLVMAIKEEMGLTVDGVGVRNDYINGFLKGLKDKFAEQVEKESWALVLVKDQAVTQKYNSMQFSTRSAKSSVRGSGDSSARTAGYQAGKSFETSTPKGKLK